jgi:hypothetical protein
MAVVISYLPIHGLRPSSSCGDLLGHLHGVMLTLAGIEVNWVDMNLM